MRPRSILATTAVAMAGVVGLALMATPSQAYPNAFYHTQTEGNRGVDVQAIQYLLRAAGESTPVDGVFTADTTTAVTAFQAANQLDPDGIVGPLTWGALTVPLAEGDSGPAVRALQVQLNAKRQLELEVDGSFDAEDTDAVRGFQSDAGIGVDGVVGDETWTNLVWHYDYPDFSVGMCNQDPDNNGDADWGTGATIGQLEEAVRNFGTDHGEVPLGDIGFELGGDIPGHSSHEVGLDVDLWPIRTDSAQCSAGRIEWDSPEYDREATRQLVQAIRDAAPGHVALIFFNDPELIAEGLTTEYPNHDNHLHVRYCEAVHPNSLYTC